MQPTNIIEKQRGTSKQLLNK